AFTANRSALHPHPRVPHSAPQLSFSCSGASQETHSRCPDAPDAQSVPDAQSALRAARWPDVVRRSCVRASTKAGLRLGAARERRTGSTWGSSRRFRLRSQLPWSQLPWSQLPWSQLPRARREMHPPHAGAPDPPARAPLLACRRRCGYVRLSLAPEEPPMNLNLVAHATLGAREPSSSRRARPSHSLTARSGRCSASTTGRIPITASLPSELSELRQELEAGESVAASWPSPCAVRLDPYRGGRWLPDVIANGDDLLTSAAAMGRTPDWRTSC